MDLAEALTNANKVIEQQAREIERLRKEHSLGTAFDRIIELEDEIARLRTERMEMLEALRVARDRIERAVARGVSGCEAGLELVRKVLAGAAVHSPSS